MSGSVAGAEMITFLAPASRCLAAPSRLVNRPVDSITTSTPRSPQGRAAGSFSFRTLSSLAVDADAVLGDLDLAGEAAQDRVVLEQVGDHLGVDQVVDRDELEIRPRLIGGPEKVPADSPEAVDAHLDCHLKSS